MAKSFLYFLMALYLNGSCTDQEMHESSHTFPTLPAFIVPVEIKTIPEYGAGHRGIFALDRIPARTKVWAHTDRVSQIHYTDMEQYITHHFVNTESGGTTDEDISEKIRIFIRQGYVLPKGHKGDMKADEYFNTNPTDYGRFVNHSPQPTIDQNGTVRDVEIGEEITIDYNFFGNPEWYQALCAKYGVLTEQEVAAGSCTNTDRTS